MTLRTVALVALFLGVLLAGCSQPSAPPPVGMGAHVGDTVGYFTIQKINQDSVDGSENIPWPVRQPEGNPRTIHVGDEVGAACEGRTYLLTHIDFEGQNLTFVERLHETTAYGCPICLSGDTAIETPDGPVNIKTLHIGSIVWALKDGQRQAVEVTKAGRALAPHHHVVHLILADGRELWASPGHPLTDHRLIGALQQGDALDGSRVASAELVPYDQPYTYDIKAGDGYWANGILVASTLG